MRTVANIILVYKIMRRIVNCSAVYMGLIFRCTNTRKGHIVLEQPNVPYAFESYFRCRVPIVWNKLNLSVMDTPSVQTFKKSIEKQPIAMKHNNGFYTRCWFINVYVYLLRYLYFSFSYCRRRHSYVHLHIGFYIVSFSHFWE